MLAYVNTVQDLHSNEVDMRRLVVHISSIKNTFKKIPVNALFCNGQEHIFLSFNHLACQVIQRIVLLVGNFNLMAILVHR